MSNPKFCSRSCAAMYNNTRFPKRHLERLCARDGCCNLVKSHRHSLCEVHSGRYQEWRASNVKNKTLGEYRENESLKGKHPSWLYSAVRLLNRSWNKELLKLPCAECGYNRHVELCHIKPLRLFPDTALLGEVNSKENNIQLCPTHHWELDNGFLNIGDLR